MGYYSEVAIVIAKEAHEDFLNALVAETLKQQCTTGECDPAALLRCAEKEEYEESVVYRWSSIKWYEYDDPDVEAIMNALKRINCSNYKFYRLGEEYGDFVERGSFDRGPYFCATHTLEMF